LQDSAGDTPLFDAVDRTDTAIVDLLLASNKIDFALKNGKSFNILHRAALRGNAQ
jgi:ankyrin repeat protein